MTSRNLPVISVSDSCSTSSIAKTRQSDGCMVDCASGRGATSNARKQEWQWAKRAVQRRFLHSPSQKCTLCTIYKSTNNHAALQSTSKAGICVSVCNVVGSEILRMKPPLNGMTDCRSEHLRNNALHDRGWGFSILTPFCPLPPAALVHTGISVLLSGLWTDLRRGGRASNIVQPTSLH